MATSAVSCLIGNPVTADIVAIFVAEVKPVVVERSRSIGKMLC